MPVDVVNVHRLHIGHPTHVELVAGHNAAILCFVNIVKMRRDQPSGFAFTSCKIDLTDASQLKLAIA